MKSPILVLAALSCLACPALLAGEKAPPPKEMPVEEMKRIPLREPYKPGWIGWLHLPGPAARPASIPLGKDAPAFWTSWPKDAPRPMPWVDASIEKAKGEQPPEAPPLAGLTRLHVLPDDAAPPPERRRTPRAER